MKILSWSSFLVDFFVLVSFKYWSHELESLAFGLSGSLTSFPICIRFHLKKKVFILTLYTIRYPGRNPCICPENSSISDIDFFHLVTRPPSVLLHIITGTVPSIPTCMVILFPIGTIFKLLLYNKNMNSHLKHYIRRTSNPEKMT